MDIVITRTTMDGIHERRKFKTIKGARAYVRKWLGDVFDIGSSYAICAYGIQKIEAEGASLEDVCQAK